MMTTQSVTEINKSAIEEWEHELDQLGPFAKHSDLIRHLTLAPLGAPSREYLSKVVTGEV
jgi:hypothetical protein